MNLFFNYFFLFIAIISFNVSYGSPNADVVVAKDGSGDYTTVQGAIDAVPDFRKERTVIFIKKGIYKEKLVLPASKTNVSLIGEEVLSTILTFDDYASKKNTYGEEMGTTGSSSFFIFGEGLYAENITFENSAGPVGQAVAVRVSADKVYFEKCRFLGYQDTLYPQATASRQYYRNCYIEGTTDFIFGASTALFENCEIKSKAGGQYITAASTLDTVGYGFVFKDCKITGPSEGSTFLGRPWRPYAKTVFINCEMDASVKGAGWNNWGKESNELSSFYAEYGSKGPGAKTSERVGWSHQLTAEQLKYYENESILSGWNPLEFVNN